MDGFRVGDLVRLNSGGPVMTVAGETNGNILCLWLRRLRWRDGHEQIIGAAEFNREMLTAGRQGWRETERARAR